MKLLLVICIATTLSAVAVLANPVPAESIDMLRIPLAGSDKELDVLTLADQDGKLSERNKRTIGILREMFPQLSQVAAESDPNAMDASDINEELRRIVREVAASNAIEEQVEEQQDQQTAESQGALSSASDDSGASSALDELTLDGEDGIDDENRNKRFLNFGFGASGGSGGAGGGGSGNFLFDIIRLVGGTSGTQQTDEAANSPDAAAAAPEAPRADGYTEGIPGPVTRLFVLANRGLSNLIQDLILRVAQTSERVVNFKARLITSLI